MLPSHSQLLFFLSAAALLIVIPGPAVFYIVGRSIGQGRAAGLVSVLGIHVGTLIHVAAAAIGLSALLMSSAFAFSAVKYSGAAYLVYLGVQKLRRRESFEISPAEPQTRLRRVFADGIIVNVLNPKTALFFFAFLPQFVNPARGHVPVQIFLLGMVMITIGLASDTVWSLSAGTVAQVFRRNARWMRTERYVSGGILISLGVATALAGPGTRK
ncbi:MAG: LysE family translocator [Candidatus Acidiferrum sp.]